MKGRFVGIGILIAVGMAVVLSAVWLLGGKRETEQAMDESPLREVAPATADRQEVGTARPVTSGKTFVGGKAFILAPAPPDDEGPAREFIASLLPASNAGDARATYRIYLRVRACRFALSDGTDSDREAYRKLGLEKDYLRSQAKTLDECASLGPNEPAWSENWLDKAARQGSLEAQLLYASDPGAVLSGQELLADPGKATSYKQKALEYLNGAASQGSVDALFALSNAYENGILVGKDPMVSHAYDLVLRRINDAYVAESTNAEKRSRLSKEQLERSLALSKRIYENCCM